MRSHSADGGNVLLEVRGQAELCAAGVGALRQSLKEQKVQFRRLPEQAGQDCVGLPSMMGLVIEPVCERRP